MQYLQVSGVLCDCVIASVLCVGVTVCCVRGVLCDCVIVYCVMV